MNVNVKMTEDSRLFTAQYIDEKSEFKVDFTTTDWKQIAVLMSIQSTSMKG